MIRVVMLLADQYLWRRSQLYQQLLWRQLLTVTQIDDQPQVRMLARLRRVPSRQQRQLNRLCLAGRQ